jgi:redox-sensitive bicupin YhaK (pirin superfamily)
MEKVLHHAEDRGRGDHGWLTTRYSFSFADWYEPERMGFGALRVLNDDRIAEGAGFPPHGHTDMEIITIVTEGAVAHKDSTGTDGVVRAGEVQVMSAGTGVVHSEFNASHDEPLELFQIWIEPAEKGGAPRYDQRAFAMPNAGEMRSLVGPMDAKDTLGIRQNAYISRARIDPAHGVRYALHGKGKGAYVFCIEGSLTADGVRLGKRDALGITDASAVAIASDSEADVLIIEVPA